MTRKTTERRPARAAEPPDCLLTVAEIAERDRCSEKTVRRAIAAGLLEAMRIGPGGRLLRIAPEARTRHRAARRA